MVAITRSVWRNYPSVGYQFRMKVILCGPTQMRIYHSPQLCVFKIHTAVAPHAIRSPVGQPWVILFEVGVGGDAADIEESVVHNNDAHHQRASQRQYRHHPRRS